MRSRMRFLVLTLSVGLCFAVPAVARADVGFSNTPYGGGGYTNWPAYYNSSGFKTLMTGMGVKYQRFPVLWVIAGTANTSGNACLAPSTGVGSDLAALEKTLSEAEPGYIPVIAIFPDAYAVDGNSGNASGQAGSSGQAWPSGADIQVWPTDADEYCGVQALETALQTSTYGNLLPSTTMIEAMNEPDLIPAMTTVGLGHSCVPSNSSVTAADCAARYWADTAEATDATTDGPTDNDLDEDNIIAGTFGLATPAATKYGSNLTTCNGGFDSNVMCYMANGDSAGDLPFGGGPLFDEAYYATQWSFHDYADVAASSTCTATSGTCSHAEVTSFKTLMNEWRYDPTNMWVTEAGDEHAYSQSRQQQADEAYGWEKLKGSGGTNVPGHLFWYQYSTVNLAPTATGQNATGTELAIPNTNPVKYYDPFDTALVDGVSPSTPNGTDRESYCVLDTGSQNTITSCTG